MGTQFDWQTDVEEKWEKLEPTSRPVRKRRGRVPPLIPLFLFMAALAAAGLWQINRRVTQANTQAAEAVRTVHALIHQAIRSQDIELLRTLIARPNQSWPEMQIRLIQGQLYLDRSPLGLWALPLNEITPITVTLAPDLQSAYVTTDHPYLAITAPGTTVTITLQHTAYYQQQQAYWLLSPLPADDFWGPTQTITHTHLILTYPRRDEPISLRLAEELGSQIGRFCLVRHCPADFVLHLQFSPEQTSLWAMQDRRQEQVAQFRPALYQLILPSPTLVGLPVDETGYQAVQYGYTTWLINHLLLQQQSWAVTAAAPTLVADGWLNANPATTKPLAALPLLPEQTILAACWDRNEAAALYVYDFAAATWQRHPANELWVGERLSRQRLQFLILPDDATFLIWTETVAQNTNSQSRFVRQYWHWQGSEGRLLWQTSEAYPPDLWLKMLPPLDQTNRYLPLVYPITEANQRTLFFYHRLPWEAETGNLSPPLNEPPTWSPQLSYAILSGRSGSLTHINESDNYRVYLDQGHSPFWLDEATFGYVRYLTGETWSETELVLVERLDEWATRLQKEVIITGADLVAAAAFYGEQGHIFIHQVIQSPTDPAILLILARTFSHGMVEMSYLFTLNIQTNQLTLLARERRLGEPIIFSPNGRYVSRVTYEAGYWALTVHDLQAGTIQQWPASLVNTIVWQQRYDWSQDEQWLLLAANEMIRLLPVGLPLTANSQEVSLPLPQAGCYAVGWLSP